MKNHVLKTDAHIFDEVESGVKTFEFRKNDRGFEVGDMLTLLRTRYTASEMADGMAFSFSKTLTVKVTHILLGPHYGVPLGFAIMSITSEL